MQQYLVASTSIEIVRQFLQYSNFLHYFLH